MLIGNRKEGGRLAEDEYIVTNQWLILLQVGVIIHNLIMNPPYITLKTNNENLGRTRVILYYLSSLGCKICKDYPKKEENETLTVYSYKIKLDDWTIKNMSKLKKIDGKDVAWIRGWIDIDRTQKNKWWELKTMKRLIASKEFYNFRKKCQENNQDAIEVIIKIMEEYGKKPSNQTN